MEHLPDDPLELVALLRKPEVTRFPDRNREVSRQVEERLSGLASEIDQNLVIRNRLREIVHRELIYAGRCSARILAGVYRDGEFFSQSLSRRGFHALSNILHGYGLCRPERPAARDLANLLAVTRLPCWYSGHKREASAILGAIIEARPETGLLIREMSRREDTPGALNALARMEAPFFTRRVLAAKLMAAADG